MTVWLHQQRAAVIPFGAPDRRTVFTPASNAPGEARAATMILSRLGCSRDSFAGHPMNTAWDPLHRAYFNGEALWTYLTTPFLLAMDGVRVDETEPWHEGAATWRAPRAYCPGSIEIDCLGQDFCSAQTC